jgi:uncharacterized membrane protein YphA (DoxX/SURF4 family)
MSKYSGDKGYQAFRILQVAFVVAPIVAGLDKFFYFLTNWTNYLSPFAMQMMQGQHRGFMIVVGIVEIIVGIGVIFKPKIFAYIVFLWLLCIVINLISADQYLDVALRDIGLMLSALALARLSHKYSH